jgi:tetratricopeptide (TPR) repeat protein
LASGYEKAFHRAVETYVGGDTEAALDLFRQSSEKDTSDKALADGFFAGLLSAQLGRDEQAIVYLEEVVAAARALPDPLMEKYVPGGGISVPVTEYVAVDVPFGSLAAALTLAEVYQRNARTDEAIGLLQQLVEVEPDPFLVLSLCDLYAEAGAWDEIVEVAAGTANEDDVSLQVRLYQARALREQGLRDAALEAYKDALRSQKRDRELLLEARYGRARLLLETGKKAQARKDLEKVYAEDPRFRDVRDLLESLDDGSGPSTAHR